MSKRSPSWLVVLLVAALLTVAIGSLVVLPLLFYPGLSGADLAGVTDTRTRIELRQAQGQLQNNARAILLQGLAGALVVAGAVATWRQVQITRDGQITDRFTHAIDQLGSRSADVRIGGIYALERIAKNSPEDRRTVQYILGSYVRNHAQWSVGSPKGPVHPTPTVDAALPWLTVRAPDIQAAISVLGRRLPHPGYARLYLPRVDLRRARLAGADWPGTNLEYTNLAAAWLTGANLNRTNLTGADLRHVHAAEATFVDAVLCHAYLEGADLHGADLRGADLRGADMRAIRLGEATLTGAQADADTIWPPGFAGRLSEHGLLISQSELEGPEN